MPGSLPVAILLGIVALLQATISLADADSVLAHYSFRENSLNQWKLPNKLQEISGLVFHNGRLFGHDDQLGIIYQIDYREAKLIKAFALGTKKTLRADFEGIAVVGDSFYLVTSDGRLYLAREGGNGERVPYKTFRTGLGRRCEIEGLAHDAARKRLLLVCKEPRSEALSQHVAVFAWSTEQQQLLESGTIMIDRSAILERTRQLDFNPSGIEVEAKTGHLLVVAARQQAIAEIGLDGNVISAFRLPLARRHYQAEGIALTAERELILADEGGSKKARLAVYKADR